MSCCFRKDSKVKRSPGESPLDRQLLEACQKLLVRGDVLLINPVLAVRRRLEGALSLLLMRGEKVLAGSRAGSDLASEVMEVPAEGAFNYTQVDEREKVAEIVVGGQRAGAGVPVAVFVNVAPLCKEHLVFIPRCSELLPHHITEETLLCGLNILGMSDRLDFRLVFDSLAAAPNINHFHFDGFYLSTSGLKDGKFVIETVNRNAIAGNLTPGGAMIELLQETTWYVRGFAVSAGPKAGEKGFVCKPDLEALARVAALLVNLLQKRDIPHTLILQPPGHAKLPREVTWEQMQQGSFPEGVQCSMTPVVFVVPRLKGEATPHLGVELGGWHLARTEDEYADLTEEALWKRLRAEVACPSESFDELLCKAAWLTN